MMRTLSLMVGTFLAFVAVLVAFGSMIGGPELVIWLLVLIAAEVSVQRRGRRRARADRAM
jgi:hypothetical protein